MQGQQNLAATRVVDPLLTEIARGYSSPRAPIANLLFPIVTVGARAGRFLNFGPDDFKLVSTVRAPGANTKRVQFGYSADAFSLYDYRLEGAVPREHEEEAAATMPALELATTAIRRVQNMMALEREAQAADLATNPAKYAGTNTETLSGTAMWDNPDSDPVDDIDEAKEIIRRQTGETPNVLALGPRVLTKLRRHPKLMDKISTSKDRVPLTKEQLAALFEVETVESGGAVKHDGAKFVDIWGTSAVLAFTTSRSAQEQGSPSFGYTYRLNGRPMVEEPYFDNNTVTWYYPHTDAYQAALVGAAAGFLFRNTVAPAA
jgi:hypothetical protein